jgi:hypothetical protein
LNCRQFRFEPSIPGYNSWLGNQTFSFLNIEKKYESKINWNDEKNGKLWAYNLNYFEFLFDENLPVASAKELMLDYVSNLENNHIGLESYPLSLRLINWVKWMAQHQITDKKLCESIFQQAHLLSKNVEYHLLGNHVIENAFALLLSGHFIGNKDLFEKGKKIIRIELNRQILNDGAHIELSPMYHSIMLTRLLDCVNVLKSGNSPDVEFDQLLKSKAALMLGWLKRIQFNNGALPDVNDSTNGISPSPFEIVEYAKRLNISAAEINLIESGYRKFENDKYELLIDVGDIQPSYQPGHAHADTTNFILNIDNKPFITDTGVSTYERNACRMNERSTSAHNTVTINEQNSSDVWEAFRVGRRSKIIGLKETDNSVSCKHDGYAHLGVLHERKFICNSVISIHDQFEKTGNRKNKLLKKSAYIHFHPSVDITLKGVNEVDSNLAKIIFENMESIKIIHYNYALGFNQRMTSNCVEIQFLETLTTMIIPK